jgi:hypothetical protein
MDSNTGLSVLGIGTGIVVHLLAMRSMRPLLKGSLFGIGGLLILAGLWGILHGPVVGDDSDARKTSTTMRQERPTNSPGILGSGNTTIYNMSPENKEQVEPTGVGKYVCTTSLSAGAGKHALLVEFGVRRGQTEGFYGEVHFATPYEKQEAWVGAPLRTDKQGGMLVQMSRTVQEKLDHTAYVESFVSPVLTPHRSYYLYFEANQLPELKEVAFIEDPQALTDQLRTNMLAKQVEQCPL